MRHPDQESLAAAAVDVRADHDRDVAAHVASCPECAAEVDAYREVLALARADVRPVPPPEHVWDAIEAELAADADADEPRRSLDLMLGTADDPDHDDGVRRLPPRSARPQGARWWLPVAAAALVGATVGAVIVGVVASDDPQEGVVVAEAQLDALPGAVGARGTVRLLGDGPTSILEVDAELPTPGGFYEVWLADADLGRMYSVGVLDDDGHGRFTLPPGGGLSEFRTIDVSAEDLDGDPAHSTISVLRADLG